MIRGIHHTAISTADLERSVRFYRDLLGFEQVFASGWEAGAETADKITGLKDSSGNQTNQHDYLDAHENTQHDATEAEMRQPR